MVSANQIDLLPQLDLWLQAEPTVCSAVLFGSRARAADTPAPPDGWSDVDLHIITSSVERMVSIDWQRVIPDARFCLRVLRPATGGVTKLTAIFTEGEADIVLAPRWQMCIAALALKLRAHRRIRTIRIALNAFAMPISYGYRFLKGEQKWGALYAKVVAEMEGFRLGNVEVQQLAEIFLCDLLYLLQKLERGELVASQRVLHRSLNETNLMLLHELRVRRGELSIQQARRVEQLASPSQLATVQVSARLDRAELVAAAWRAREGLDILLSDLLPAWHPAESMEALLARYTPTRAK